MLGPRHAGQCRLVGGELGVLFGLTVTGVRDEMVDDVAWEELPPLGLVEVVAAQRGREFERL